MPRLRPADECPFQRPLVEGTFECPTFHPVPYLPLDTRHKPLAAVLSCRHMQVAVRQSEPRAFYCRCAIGDLAARRQTAAAMAESRLQLLRRLAGWLNGLIAAHSDELVAAKARELAAQARHDRERAQADVHAVAERFEAAARGGMRVEMLGTLAALGVDPDALLRIIQGGLADYESNGFESWEVPDELLAGLPADVALFIKGSPVPRLVPE